MVEKTRQKMHKTVFTHPVSLESFLFSIPYTVGVRGVDPERQSSGRIPVWACIMMVLLVGLFERPRDVRETREREMRWIARICVWTLHISPWKRSRSNFGSLAFKIRIASADEKSYEDKYYTE